MWSEVPLSETQAMYLSFVLSILGFVSVHLHSVLVSKDREMPYTTYTSQFQFYSWTHAVLWVLTGGLGLIVMDVVLQLIFVYLVLYGIKGVWGVSNAQTRRAYRNFSAAAVLGVMVTQPFQPLPEIVTSAGAFISVVLAAEAVGWAFVAAFTNAFSHSALNRSNQVYGFANAIAWSAIWFTLVLFN